MKLFLVRCLACFLVVLHLTVFLLAGKNAPIALQERLSEVNSESTRNQLTFSKWNKQPNSHRILFFFYSESTNNTLQVQKFILKYLDQFVCWFWITLIWLIWFRINKQIAWTIVQFLATRIVCWFWIKSGWFICYLFDLLYLLYIFGVQFGNTGFNYVFSLWSVLTQLSQLNI